MTPDRLSARLRRGAFTDDQRRIVSGRPFTHRCVVTPYAVPSQERQGEDVEGRGDPALAVDDRLAIRAGTGRAASAAMSAADFRTGGSSFVRSSVRGRLIEPGTCPTRWLPNGFE